MTESPFHVPSSEKIACPLDKATAVALFEIATLSFVRALIADWLKSCRRLGVEGPKRRESSNYDGQRRFSGESDWSNKGRKRKTAFVREKTNAWTNCIHGRYVTCYRVTCSNGNALQNIRALFDLFPHYSNAVKFNKAVWVAPAVTRHRISRMSSLQLRGFSFSLPQPVSLERSFKMLSNSIPDTSWLNASAGDVNFGRR